MIPEIPEWNELEKYVGKWVAVVDEKVVSTGDTAKAVYEEAKKSGKVPLVFQVPEEDEIYLLKTDKK